MKLITASIVICVLLFTSTFFLQNTEFFYMALVSIFPLNIFHWNNTLREIHENKSTYKGLRILMFPPLIYFFLIVTHHKWLPLF